MLAFNAWYRYTLLWYFVIRTDNSDTNYYCLVIIGVPLVALWLYVDANSKHQKKINNDTSITTQVCLCSICKHEEAKTCFGENRACCLLTKETLSSDIPLIHCIRTSYRSFTLSRSSLFIPFKDKT
jgi:hypothetical protein